MNEFSKCNNLENYLQNNFLIQKINILQFDKMLNISSVQIISKKYK